MKCIYIFLPLFTLFSLSAFSQVFKIYELDRYTKDSTIAPIKNGSFADINSTLYITFDKLAIAEAIRDFTGNDTMSIDQLKQLKIVLANQVDIMEGFKAYNKDKSLESLNNLAEQMTAFMREARQYPDIRALFNKYTDDYDNKYSASEQDQAGTNGIPQLEEYIFTEMAKRAAELSQQIQAALSSGDVRFRLSGRLSTDNGERDIKLSDDFDTFAADVFTVPRWQATMTPEGQQQLQDIAGLSLRLNSLMDVKGQDIKNWLADSFGAEDCLKDIENRLLSIPQVVASIVPTLAQRAKALAEQPYQQAKKLSDEYANNIAASPGITSVELLEGFNSRLQGTVDSIKTLISSVDNNLIAMLKSEVPQDTQITAFITTFNSCKQSLLADRSKLLDITGRLSLLFGNSKRAAKASSGLSDQVRRLSFDAIPDESFIDLRNSGPRTNGDQLKIRAILEAASDDNTKPIRKTIDQRMFTLQQIGMYSILKPMMLLAAPNGSGDNVDLAGKNFQFAPSYSILFKFGSRKSKVFNDILQPGFGVNFGALDFNTDAVPEFGAALEFTFLRDYFSGGYGYNFGADKDYFFIGFRLPIGAIPLPIFNEVQAK
jgi:hypothetical protein